MVEILRAATCVRWALSEVLRCRPNSLNIFYVRAQDFRHAPTLRDGPRVMILQPLRTTWGLPKLVEVTQDISFCGLGI